MHSEMKGLEMIVPEILSEICENQTYMTQTYMRFTVYKSPVYKPILIPWNCFQIWILRLDLSMLKKHCMHYGFIAESCTKYIFATRTFCDIHDGIYLCPSFQSWITLLMYSEYEKSCI